MNELSRRIAAGAPLSSVAAVNLVETDKKFERYVVFS